MPVAAWRKLRHSFSLNLAAGVAGKAQLSVAELHPNANGKTMWAKSPEKLELAEGRAGVQERREMRQLLGPGVSCWPTGKHWGKWKIVLAGNLLTNACILARQLDDVDAKSVTAFVGRKKHLTSASAGVAHAHLRMPNAMQMRASFPYLKQSTTESK